MFVSTCCVCNRRGVRNIGILWYFTYCLWFFLPSWTGGRIGDRSATHFRRPRFSAQLLWKEICRSLLWRHHRFMQLSDMQARCENTYMSRFGDKIQLPSLILEYLNLCSTASGVKVNRGHQESQERGDIKYRNSSIDSPSSLSTSAARKMCSMCFNLSWVNSSSMLFTRILPLDSINAKFAHFYTPCLSCSYFGLPHLFADRPPISLCPPIVGWVSAVVAPSAIPHPSSSRCRVDFSSHRVKNPTSSTFSRNTSRQKQLSNITRCLLCSYKRNKSI